MNKIIWNESLSVGISEIDQQHQHLIEIINKLTDYEHIDVGSEIISDTLTDLTEYCSYHFDTEEQLMSEYYFPDLLSHKSEHDKFKKQIVLFCIDTIHQNYNTPFKIFSFLNEWIKDHLLETDMKYKDFLISKGVT